MILSDVVPFKSTQMELYLVQIQMKIIFMSINDGFEESKEYESMNNPIHYKDCNGFEYWQEFDSNANPIHYKDTDDNESWYNSRGNTITKQEFDESN